jgi:hypothetical protein
MKKLALLFWALASTLVQAQDDFGIPEEAASEKLELSGSFDVDYSIFWSNKDSPLYQLLYHNQDLSDILSSYPLEFYLNGDYQTRDIGVHFKTASEYFSDKQLDFNVFELYGNLNLSDSSFLLLGQKMYNWGKGYAFNPVGYVNPTKDPENPELAHAGVVSMGFEYSKSFQSNWMQNLSFDLIVLPSERILSNMPSEIGNTALVGKLYFLLWDTDIDFMSYYSGDTGTVKIGADFSRNIIPNVEVHGELSAFNNQAKYIISGGVLQSERISGASYLVGLRWLNKWNITTILEYYHSGAGLTGKEFTDYAAFLLDAAASNDSARISTAINTNKTYFSGPSLMQDYLYLKVSWPEPFSLVDFTPSTYVIYNIVDNSLAIGIPLAYNPVTNLAFLFQPTFFLGNDGTEFGGKQYRGKLEIQAAYYF